MWFQELEKDEKTFIALENIKWREKIHHVKDSNQSENCGPLKSKW